MMVWILYIWLITASGELELVSNNTYLTAEACDTASKEITFDDNINWIAQCREERQR